MKTSGMKSWKPDYYDAFVCSASDCRYTCCQEWNIAVDHTTREKWKMLRIPEDVQGIDGFSGKTHLSDLVKGRADNYSIDMGKSSCCPLLNEEQLCHAVLAYGEDALSYTCHTFPRKCQKYSQHFEYSLDTGCPEVLRLLWDKKSFSLLEQESEQLTESMKELAAAAEASGKQESAEHSEKADEEEKLLLLIREQAMKLTAREDIPVSEALIMLFGLMLNFYEEENLQAEYVKNMFSDQVIRSLQETVKKAGRNLIDHFTERNELFLDLSENYRKKKLYEAVLEELADRAEWFELTDDGYVTDTYEAFEDIWKLLENRIRLILVEGLYAGMLLPGGDLYSMILKTEWLGLVLTSLKHALFLRWELDEGLEEEKALDIITIILRMTGYSDADIEEYLEASFEEPVWSWGYMALIL